MAKCECEHASHRTPCQGEVTHAVTTDYGTYQVCDPCRDLGHMPERKADPCGRCGKGEYSWSNFCGAAVCEACGDHRGLARCYCGWNLEPGEVLEDDPGEARFTGEGWEVDY